MRIEPDQNLLHTARVDKATGVDVTICTTPALLRRRGGEPHQTMGPSTIRGTEAPDLQSRGTPAPLTRCSNNYKKHDNTLTKSCIHTCLDSQSEKTVPCLAAPEGRCFHLSKPGEWRFVLEIYARTAHTEKRQGHK